MDRAEVVVMCLTVVCYLVGVAVGAFLALFLRAIFAKEPWEKWP